MNNSQTSLNLIAETQNCSKCNKSCSRSFNVSSEIWFYCEYCEIYTKWSYGTKLQFCKLNSCLIEKLLTLFLANKTLCKALDLLKTPCNGETVHITTVRRYFTTFCHVVLDYYHQETEYILLEKDVEIDETHLFREKNSSAPHRRYKLSSVWIFGAKQRNSSKFFLIPLKNRKEETLVPIIRKHIKVGSNIYSDSFSVYINNKTKESKLQRFFFLSSIYIK